MKTMTFKITQLPPDRWQAYRDIRLEGLQADPLAFGSTYQEEVALTEEQWRNRIICMWFALDDDRPVGMIGLMRDTGVTGKHRAHVISLWVKPAFRGQGIGGKLIRHLQELAPTEGIRKLYLHVTSTQKDAIVLYEKQGFRKVGLLEENSKVGDEYLGTYLMEWLCGYFGR